MREIIDASRIVKYTNIFPNTNIELTNSAVAIFAKSAKISPAEFALMWSLGAQNFSNGLKIFTQN
jgi:hypothetical protein